MALEQRMIHIVFELLAVFVFSPFLIYVASQKVYKNAIITRTLLYVFAIGTIILDGYLAITWFMS